MNTVILIPARLNSGRLKKKMLADLEGAPLIVRTWQQACRSALARRVVIATDSSEIADVMTDCGAEVVMTSPEATCGTERIAEAAREIEADVYINLQGDEPLIDPRNIDKVAEPFFSEHPPDCSTLVYPVLSEDFEELNSPDIVKVVMDRHFNAMYFSRSPLPYQRYIYSSTRCYRHIGVYAFSAEVLKAFSRIGPSMLEQAESLEQLRLLEYGYRIRCVETASDMPGVNTFEDLELVRSLYRSRQNGA
ncbi:3-deoxy-manno-octulosonate cytidylyltransferase [Prosthecochloris sp. HL-130-GSB]|jgi:3-deoxy-manno-octulosonate cytidylyltransferase (CMP-KDO synthetase)|uniref:3-deoxy-manno-octulosonate cytidylyltransferase n=1 Tax=Prosthecochloris sp. HL-130-GSB TaxID=1974213 RepID=UPI000A1C0F44|nr:3-deoxy-manno-octulosonate cytidylyltransferase [Prosthecochloris sp. HL-130-GSB]ARM31470.1 3-deoxy-D-manno-octulosonate cytidylyltransferase [Prosthecochloris sp. HL-130-GSB]